MQNSRGDLKGGIEMIPFNYLNEDDACLLDFIAKVKQPISKRQSIPKT
jgi:hypothetical protein